MKKPNFFILGAPKCGTTWLYTYLKLHPGVFMPDAKEPHYFNSDSGFRRFRTLEEYEALFDDVPEHKAAIGEASVWNLYSKTAASNILEYSPDAKFIVLVRNPVEMAQSLHRQMFFNNDEDRADFMASWSLQEDRSQGRSIPQQCREPSMLLYSESCALGTQLARLLSLVPRDRVHIIVQDDIKEDPTAVYVSVLDFLGLERIVPEKFNVVHAARKRRSQTVKRIIDSLAGVKKRMGINVRFGILSSISKANVGEADRLEISESDFKRIASSFAGEIALLEQITGRNLSHWTTR